MARFQREILKRRCQSVGYFGWFDICTLLGLVWPCSEYDRRAVALGYFEFTFVDNFPFFLRLDLTCVVVFGGVA